MRDILFLGLLLCSGLVQAAPPPGHPTTDQAGQIMGIDQQAPMQLHGQVLKAVDSNNYTYIQIQPRGVAPPRWIAAPRLELQAGQQLRYPQGVLMRNFYSKKLKHRFDEIWFVPAVQVVNH